MHAIHHHHQNQQPQPAADVAVARRGLLPVLLVAQLMVVLDISATNIALPSLARDLHISASNIGWTITSYTLLFGSLLLLGGRAADLLGRRRVFFTGLTVFTACSLASALATTAGWLFAARAGQGLGAAMLSPAALSIITSSFQGPARMKALGAWSAAGAAGGAIGVLMGGVLTQVADWRAIFYINLPVALLVTLAGRHVVPADPAQAKWRGLDLRGAVVATISLAALVYGVSQAEVDGWTSSQTLGSGLAGLAGLLAFAILERRASTPLLRVGRIRDRAIGGGFALMLVAAAVLFGNFVTLSLYVQGVLGKSPLTAGLSFLPLALSTAAGAHLGARIVGQFGIRVTMAGAFLVATAGAFFLAGLGAAGSYSADVLPGMIVVGLGVGALMLCGGLSILTGARPEEAGMLSGLNTTGHEIGGTLGIAAIVTVATAGAGGLGAVGGTGIDHAYLVIGAVAAFGSILASIVLPSAQSFLPKLQLSPNAMPEH
jgi:EmrB/QacA subfamily drug resistance transporter